MMEKMKVACLNTAKYGSNFKIEWILVPCVPVALYSM
jgi:hypothetical protein